MSMHEESLHRLQTLEVLHQNLEIARNFQPLPASSMEGLRKRCQAQAADGHNELFKMTVKYDGKVGREQHHFQNEEELPLSKPYGIAADRIDSDVVPPSPPVTSKRMVTSSVLGVYVT